MDPELRIVTRLPLQELWRDDGFSPKARLQWLNHDDIRQILRSGPVQFVVADVGFALRWIPTSECFAFWKDEAKIHLATGTRVVLDDFPGGYFYFASHWEGQSTAPMGPAIHIDVQRFCLICVATSNQVGRSTCFAGQFQDSCIPEHAESIT